MYLACFTEDEIADKVGMPKMTISDRIKLLCTKTYPSTNSYKLSRYDDDTFQIPLYTVWAFGKDTNGNVGKEAIYTKNTETVNTHNSITLYQGALIGVVDFSKTDIDLKNRLIVLR